MHVFGGVTGGKIESAQVFQFLGCHASLFPDLAAGACFGVFAFIQGTGRQFQEIQPGCVTVLTDKEQVALFIHREDDDRSRMFDDIKSGFMTIRQAQGITADR